MRLRRFTLCISGLSSPKRLQYEDKSIKMRRNARICSKLLGLSERTTPFMHFWAQLAKWLSGSLWRLIKHFWAQLAKGLSGSLCKDVLLWRLIFSISGLSSRPLRKPLEAHFQHFWAQLAKCQMRLRRLLELILTISGLSSPNGSQETSAGSFSPFLGSARQMRFRRPVEAHFEHFWAQLAKCVSGGLWNLIVCISKLSSRNGSREDSGGSSFSPFISGLSSPNASQEASEGSF